MKNNRTPGLWSVLIVLASLTGACCPTPPPCPTPPLTEFTPVTGDGTLASAPFGPAGGRLQLGPGAQPSLLIPAGALRDTGRTMVLRRVEDGRPGGANGTPVSIPFEVTPPTEVTIDHAFFVSIALPQLPSGCEAPRLRLAVERPNDVGPGDGTGSPTLRWDYDQAAYANGTVAASLLRIHGNRLQFVCLTGGTP